MPFYIRKSVSVGPFRFNLSKSGIGVSAGIKGLRIGTGPRGHYIHAGRGGLYYRSSIPGGRKPSRRINGYDLGSPPRPNTAPAYSEPNVEMVRVSSSDVLQMEDSRFSEILDDLTAKQNSVSFATLLGVAGGVVAFFLVLGGGIGGVAALLLAATAVLAGVWLDSVKRSSVLMYDLDDEARRAYEAMTARFDVLMACSGKWHIDAGGAVRDIHTWKRNSGAAHIVDPRPTVFDYSLPRVVKSNITPPAIKSGKETLYFLPDFLLVVESGKVGAVAYDKLTIRWQDANFVVDGTVPADARVLYHTWKYPNKNGGPDRRFANNYQIPVCLYESIHLTSTNGLNELLQVSRNGVTQPFASAVATLAEVNGSAVAPASLPRLG